MPSLALLTHLGCGKSTCHCAHDQGHPVRSLTSMVKRKKHVQHFPKLWVEQVRRRVRAGRLMKMKSVCICLASMLVVSASVTAQIQFEEISENAGLRFKLENGAMSNFRQVELMVRGVAVLNYNNDGCADVFSSTVRIAVAEKGLTQVLQPAFSKQLRRGI
jgi:hypothetical protein